HALVGNLDWLQLLEHDEFAALGALARGQVVDFLAVGERGARRLRKFALLCHDKRSFGTRRAFDGTVWEKQRCRWKDAAWLGEIPSRSISYARCFVHQAREHGQG